MPVWTNQYWTTLRERFGALTAGLSDRLQAVADGRVAPAVDDIAIGSGRKLRAAMLFFDIRGFSSRTGSADPQALKRTLLMLDNVIPMVMHIIHDHNGYVEKNTGDGVMGIIGADRPDVEAANDSLDAAATIFYALRTLINPFLLPLGIAPVEARIGIDLGTVLLARIGVPTGGARHPRNFLTAVGPSANLACRLQQIAATNEIFVGDNVFRNTTTARADDFTAVTPPNWTWIYEGTNNPYWVWRYNKARMAPLDGLGTLGRLLAGRG
jgi:adenylate cyclase